MNTLLYNSFIRDKDRIEEFAVKMCAPTFAGAFFLLSLLYFISGRYWSQCRREHPLSTYAPRGEGGLRKLGKLRTPVHLPCTWRPFFAYRGREGVLKSPF